jgi:hypothetical protein
MLALGQTALLLIAEFVMLTVDGEIISVWLFPATAGPIAPYFPDEALCFLPGLAIL